MPPDPSRGLIHTRVYQVTPPKFLDPPLVKVGMAKAKCFLCSSRNPHLHFLATPLLLQLIGHMLWLI